MIVLDTNVVSELMLPHPAASVVRWIGPIPAGELVITAVTRAEIQFGVENLPEGARKNRISEVANAILDREYHDRTLPFDMDSADEFAVIYARRRRLGRPIDKFDAQIAAIAVTHGASLATRNVADFAGCGVKLIDPWRS